MDENNWNTRVDERRLDFAQVEILEVFIDRLIEYKVLPATEYEINWGVLEAEDALRKSEIQKNKTEAFAQYVSSGLWELMPFEMYLELVMGYTKAQVEEFVNTYGPFQEPEDAAEQEEMNADAFQEEE